MRLACDRARRFDVTPPAPRQIREAFSLFDTDGSGMLDDTEMHTAMFALGLASDSARRPGRHGSLLHRIDADAGNGAERNGSASLDGRRLGGAALQSGRGVTIVQFQELLRGLLLGRGGLGEIRMTYDAIVKGQGDGPGEGGRGLTFEKLRRACQVGPSVLSLRPW